MSNITQSVDAAFFFIMGVSVVLLTLVTSFMVYFAVRYSRKNHPVAHEIGGHVGLEIAWTVIPTVIVLVMFYVGYSGFRLMREVPEDTMPVKVTARMWSWLFEYENGRRSDELVLPAGRAVRLELTSKDVIHSLFIPAFRVKEDAVPGQETVMWFIAEREGVYDLFCTEYCGEGHSRMITKVKVMSADGFDEWYGAAPPSAQASGLDVLTAKGCLGCHSTDGSQRVGPTFKGILGRKTRLASGAEVAADEGYIRRSIREPGADVVEGYAPIMPAIDLTEGELKAAVEYIGGL